MRSHFAITAAVSMSAFAAIANAQAPNQAPPKLPDKPAVRILTDARERLVAELDGQIELLGRTVLPMFRHDNVYARRAWSIASKRIEISLGNWLRGIPIDQLRVAELDEMFTAMLRMAKDQHEQNQAYNRIRGEIDSLRTVVAKIDELLISQKK